MADGGWGNGGGAGEKNSVEESGGGKILLYKLGNFAY